MQILIVLIGIFAKPFDGISALHIFRLIPFMLFFKYKTGQISGVESDFAELTDGVRSGWSRVAVS